jgi:ATP-dependent Zn protease
LDQALLRPGRFDRIIKVPLPDKPSREKILSYYLKNKLLEKSFDVSLIAELTSGFSGAQLKNLVNEAAILSARYNYTTIQERYIFDAFEKSVVGRRVIYFTFVVTFHLCTTHSSLFMKSRLTAKPGDSISWFWYFVK